MEKSYIAIDLKSFYASVECAERKLDPLNTNLIVADSSRTDKTICLAVSPSLKAYGISGRARLFEVKQKIKEVNALRLSKIKNKKFNGSSHFDDELKKDDTLAVDYIIAPPRMAFYIEYSTRIYDIYLKYIAPEDIHVYSIDEVFIDATNYLSTYKMTPRELAMKMIHDVLKNTSITATAGIGTNLYLAKIAMDIVAKHIPPDKDGVRIAELDEISYRKELWNHRPITDFWRIGNGYKKKLEANAIYTMGDIARCSTKSKPNYHSEDLLYKLFGVNAELLIDHAWGYEPVTIKEIKAYKPTTNSTGSGQVLQTPYEFEKAKLVAKEMADNLSLELVSKGLVTNQIILDVGYDIENVTNNINLKEEIVIDKYGRKVPKTAHGSYNLEDYYSSSLIISDACLKLFDRIVNPDLTIRRINITAANIIPEDEAENRNVACQLDLFTDYNELEKTKQNEKSKLEKEKKIQKAMINIKEKYGKNSILKGMNLKEGATAKSRNKQIGGHKA